MPSLEDLILQTWNQLKPRLLSNPEELARRLKRTGKRSFSRPRRAWCLAVRACDRRIGVTNGRIDPEYATDPTDPDHPGRVVAHSVTLSPELVRQLCRPVVFNAWGELHNNAAKMLGTTSAGLTSARISGVLQTHHIKRLHGRRGPPVPIVYSQKMLDPSAGRGFEMPHPLWTGTECASARVRNDLSQTVMRVPVYRSTASKHQYADDVHPEMAGPPPRRERKRLPPPKPDYVWYKWSKAGEFLGEDPRYWRKHPADPGHPPPPPAQKPKRQRKPKPSRAGGSIQFNGWRWVCPKCNRRVRTLYRPVPPECVLKDEFKSACPEYAEGMKHENGINLPPPVSSFLLPLSSFLTHPSSFACSACHNICYFSAIASDSWNDLISHLSGGLLRGKDIPKPDWYKESARRKLAYRPRLRAAPRRELLLNLLLQGQTATSIAATMHLTLDDICSRISQLCKQENVPNRAALAKKYGQDPDLQPNRREKPRQRREQVLQLLALGWTTQQIAIDLGMQPQAVREDIHVLCRQHRVNGRRELVAKHRSAAIHHQMAV